MCFLESPAVFVFLFLFLFVSLVVVSAVRANIGGCEGNATDAEGMLPERSGSLLLSVAVTLPCIFVFFRRVKKSSLPSWSAALLCCRFLVDVVIVVVADSLQVFLFLLVLVSV